MNIRKKGKTIFYSSHNLSEVQDSCTAICTIHNGKIIYKGTTNGFITKYKSSNLEQAFIKSYAESGGAGA